MFWPTPDEGVAEAQHALDRVAKEFPATYDALIEAKACAVFGCMPSALEAEPGGFGQLAKFLAAKGVLEGLTRGGGIG